MAIRIQLEGRHFVGNTADGEALWAWDAIVLQDDRKVGGACETRSPRSQKEAIKDAARDIRLQRLARERTREWEADERF